MHGYLDSEARAHHVRADIAARPRLAERGLEDLLLSVKLAPHIDEAGMRTDRAAGDQNTFDDRVRIVLELVAIGERAGFALVGVAADVDRFFGILGDEAPFDAGGKSRAAASAQAGVLDLVDDLLRGHLEQRLTQRPVSAVRLVDLDPAQIR